MSVPAHSSTSSVGPFDGAQGPGAGFKDLKWRLKEPG